MGWLLHLGLSQQSTHPQKTNQNSKSKNHTMLKTQPKIVTHKISQPHQNNQTSNPNSPRTSTNQPNHQPKESHNQPNNIGVSQIILELQQNNQTSNPNNPTTLTNHPNQQLQQT